MPCMNKHTLAALVLLTVTLVTFSGCGDPLNRQAVSGTVTLKGKPLAGATIGFHKKPAADALVQTPRFTADSYANEKGEFKPSTSTAFDGLPEGEYIVTVFLTNDGKYYSGEVKEKSKLDAKYADVKTSPLKLSFKAGDKIAIDLDE